MKKHILTTVLASAGIFSANGQDNDPTVQPPSTSGIVVPETIEDEDAFNSGDYLFGGWGGRREALIDAGITPFLFYDSIFAGNTSGGLTRDNNYTDQAYGGAIFDLEKLAGWEGVTAKLSVINRTGSTISPNVGGIYDPQTIFGGQTTFLYDVWLEKNWDDKFALKVGRFSSDQDFANSDLYRYSLSTSINGPIRALLIDGAGFTFPNATWGARAKWTPSEEHQFQAGIFHLHDRVFDPDSHGADFDINTAEDGISIQLQYDWNGEIAGKRTHVYAGLNQALGFELNLLDGSGTDDTLTRYFAHIDMDVTEQLTLFSFFTYSADDEIALTPIQTSFGANYKGLIPGRPEDRTVFFFTYAQISDEAPVTSFGSRADHEIVYELNHRIQLSPAAYIQPSVQYINRPGGTGVIPDAVVVGAWVGLTF